MDRKGVALYIRLSSSDDDVGHDGKKESSSITAQRELLLSFIKSNEEFDGLPVYEYADDGFSGTSFEKREGFFMPSP